MSLCLILSVAVVYAKLCDISVSSPSRASWKIPMSSSSLNLCINELASGLQYEFRLYASGYSKFLYSPEKLRISDEWQSVFITREAKTDSVSAFALDHVVVSVDPLVFGFIPSALMPVIYVGVILVLVSVLIVHSLFRFGILSKSKLY